VRAAILPGMAATRLASTSAATATPTISSAATAGPCAAPQGGLYVDIFGAAAFT
jgi:hypothetical protein